MPVISLGLDASGALKGAKLYENAANKGEQATKDLLGAAERASGIFAGMGAALIGTATAALSLNAAVDQVAKSIEIFADFDDQLRIAASYAGATAEEFAAMGRAAEAAGATTSASASDAAKGLSELASRGFTVKESIEALTPAIRLAEAAQVDLGRATEVSSGILRGYGKDVGELGRINDVIVGISNASAASLDFVGDAAKYAIPAAKAAGQEFESVAAVLGTLADQQFEASQSGNAFKSLLISLVAPTDEAAGALDRLGITTKDSSGNLLNIIDIFKQFNTVNLNLSDSTTIFGREFATAALAISGSIGEVNKDLEFLKYGIDGITDSTADFQQAGLGGSFRQLESAVEAIYIAVGSQLSPIVKDIAVSLTEFAGNASKAAAATDGIITAVEIMAQVLLGAYNAVDIVVDALTGLFAFSVEKFPLYRGLELVAEGLEKIGAIDINPFEAAREGIQEFAAAQDGSFARVQERVENLNARFDKYHKNLQDNLKATQDREAAEQALTVAANEAATAAGQQAIAAGKSVEAALAAAEAARKAYITSTEASKAQEAADTKAAAVADKRKASLEQQAETIKAQALAYGATEEAAQAAAEKVIEAGQAAASVSGAGVDGLNASLDQTTTKAGAAQVALAGIGTVGLPTGGGGEISYSVGLSTGDYDAKVSDLKESIRALNNDYQVKINFDPEGAEKLQKELEVAKKQLEDTQAIQGYNEQLRSLQTQYRAVHQEFLGGKLSITTDPEAAANIQAQIAGVLDLKTSIDGVVPGMERVNGVWQQLPDAVATAVQPAITSLGSLASASGEIETTWQQVDGVWTEVLTDGSALVDHMTETLYSSEVAAKSFGAAVAGAAQSAAGTLSPVDQVLDGIEYQIIKTQSAAGGINFDKLATQTGAFNSISIEIDNVKRELKELDPASAEAAEAVGRLLTLEAIKDELSGNISDLKKEIYGTGEEAKKTGSKAAKAAEHIAKIPAQTKAAAESVSKLSKATEELAQTQGDLARAAWSKDKTFTFTSSNTIDGINSEIAALKEEKKIIEEMNRIIFDNADFTRKNEFARDLQQEQIQELEMKKFKITMENFLGSLGRGMDMDISADKLMEKKTQQVTINNNFQGMDRSDAVDISTESARQLRRS